jgi:hypothetical protein
MADPFRARLDPFRSANRFPFRRLLPFYLTMLVMAGLFGWSIQKRWSFVTQTPTYEQGLLISFGANGRAGPKAWVRTKEDKVVILPVYLGMLDDCRVGDTVSLERRGENLALANPACRR